VIFIYHQAPVLPDSVREKTWKSFFFRTGMRRKAEATVPRSSQDKVQKGKFRVKQKARVFVTEKC